MNSCMTKSFYQPHEDVRRGFVGRGGALLESMTFNRRVMGSTPALAAT